MPNSRIDAGKAAIVTQERATRAEAGGDRGMTPDSRPSLWRLARLDFDPVRQRPVLLYPEGAVLLNDTGKAILELVDGRRTVAEIAAILGERYGADVTADVTDYLTHLARRELIRDG